MRLSSHSLGRAAVEAALRLLRPAFTAALLFTLPVLGAQPYHLELEASPGAVFPYLGRFGDVELHVYEGGVRAEALWLNSFSRNGAADVTVVNPLARMYIEVPIADITSILRKLGGSETQVEQKAIPAGQTVTIGKVGKYDAVRNRLSYGPGAWIDVWTTEVVPENPQLKLIVNAMLQGLAPGTARAAAKFTGTPILVELNFRRYKKVQLLKLKKLTMAADDEKDALTLGSMYMRATVLEKLFEKK